MSERGTFVVEYASREDLDIIEAAMREVDFANQYERAACTLVGFTKMSWTGEEQHRFSEDVAPLLEARLARTVRIAVMGDSYASVFRVGPSGTVESGRL